jgi:Ca2+-binding EF-hand superfamily protein
MKRLFAPLLTVLSVLFLAQNVLAQDPGGPQGPAPDRRAGPNPDVLFDRLDANKDGVITPDELPPGMPEPLKQVVLSADRDHDGKVTRGELVEMFNQRGPGRGREMPPNRPTPGLDARPPEGQGPPESGQIVEAYKLRNADPQIVLKVMQTMLAGTPGVRMDVDPKANNLIVLAPPPQHNVVRTVLEQMEKPRDVLEEKPGDAAGPPFGRQGRGGGMGMGGMGMGMGGMGMGMGGGFGMGAMRGGRFGAADEEKGDVAGPPFGRQGRGSTVQGGPPFDRQGRGPQPQGEERAGPAGGERGEVAGPLFGRQGRGPGWQGGPPFRGPEGRDGWAGGPPLRGPDGRGDLAGGPQFGRQGFGPPWRDGWQDGPLFRGPQGRDGWGGGPGFGGAWGGGGWGGPPWAGRGYGPHRNGPPPWAGHGTGPRGPWAAFYGGGPWSWAAHFTTPRLPHLDLKAIFDRMDTNHDNQLSFEEFSQGVTRLLRHLSAGGGPGWARRGGPMGGQGFGPPAFRGLANYPALGFENLRERVLNRFKELDKNNDGKLSKDEAPPWIQKNFGQIDVDKDGFISPRELYRALNQLHPKPGDQKPSGKDGQKTGEKTGEKSAEKTPEESPAKDKNAE